MAPTSMRMSAVTVALGLLLLGLPASAQEGEGACFPPCRSGYACSQGTCVPAEAPACFPACRSGYVCAGGTCVPACDPRCDQRQTCTSEGECVDSSPSPEEARQRAEEQARREAEEQARREAEEQARREAEEQARREAEEQARREAEEQARREAEEQARREAPEEASQPSTPPAPPQPAAGLHEQAEPVAGGDPRDRVNVALVVALGYRSFRPDEANGQTFRTEQSSGSLSETRYPDGYGVIAGLEEVLAIPDLSLGLGLRQHVSDYFGYSVRVLASGFPLAGYIVRNNYGPDARADKAEVFFLNVGLEGLLRLRPFARRSSFYTGVGPLGAVRMLIAGSDWRVTELHFGLVGEVGILLGSREAIDLGLRFTMDDLANGENFTIGVGLGWSFFN
jgi:hypothetical protein